MKKAGLFILLALSLGSFSCYDMMNVGLNAAYIQSSADDAAVTDRTTTTVETTQAGQTSNLRDTVYLKDGSVIHGFITEEEPGASLKIKTVRGNIYTYQMADVAKITHVRSAETDEAAAEDSQAPADDDNNSDEEGAPAGQKKY
jgi:hypothetical protein